MGYINMPSLNFEISAIEVGGDTYSLRDTSKVRYDKSMSLTDTQKAQARSNIGAGTYSKPSGGIPDSDIASASTWNGKYTKPSGGIPASDLAESYYLSSNPNGYTSNTGTVIGSDLTADRFVLGNGTVNVKKSTYAPGPSSTTWSDSSDVYLPTMKSVSDFVYTNYVHRVTDGTAKRLYGVAYSEAHGLYENMYTIGSDIGQIVQRDAHGHISLPNQSTYAPSDDQAVSKRWVEAKGYTTNTGTVIGSSLTANKLILGNGGVNIKNSTYEPGPSSTTWSDSSDVYLPTMKSVVAYVTGKGYVTTDRYHTSGSWSGLTYTATANGGAGALAFTIPTGDSTSTSANYVVKCNDSRLSDARPASDVSSWAKASTKPSYNFSEIGAGVATIGDGANRLMFRTNSSYVNGIYYSTPGNEALVFATKNPVTSWMFAAMSDPTAGTSWQNLTPALQIKKQSVAINKLIGNNVDPAYNLDVNGTLNATTIYQNGTALATVATTGNYDDLSNKPTIPTDTNQKIKAGSVTFGNNDVVDIVAGDNVAVTGLASGTGAPKITISATDTDTGATSVETTGSGNVVNSASYDATTRKLTLSKGVTALTSHQSIKSLDTTATTAQATNSSEAIKGTGTITLHKIAKTGTYSDLIGKPTIPATNVIPATTTANKMLVSTTTSGTAKWSDWSSAGFLKTNASGVISVDTTSYLTTSGTAANSSKLNGQAASYYAKATDIPSAYIKSASTSGNTLTLTKQDNTTVVYTPSFTDKYHTSGSWSDLTYTATANGGAGALSFTIPTGTTSTTVALGDHTHTLSLAVDSGTSTIDLQSNTKYKLTAGGSTLVFKTPAGGGGGSTLHRHNLEWVFKTGSSSSGYIYTHFYAYLITNNSTAYTYSTYFGSITTLFKKTVLCGGLYDYSSQEDYGYDGISTAWQPNYSKSGRLNGVYVRYMREGSSTWDTSTYITSSTTAYSFTDTVETL